MEKKWIETKAYRSLYIEHVLITFDIPLLFVCINDFRHRYLGLCTNEETEEYLLCRISEQHLIELLDGKLSMKNAFLITKNDLGMIVKFDNDKTKFSERIVYICELDENMLPDKDTFYKINNRKNEDYIKKLKTLESIKLRDIIGDQGLDMEQGNTIYNIVLAAFQNNKIIELDFGGIKNIFQCS